MDKVLSTLQLVGIVEDKDKPEVAETRLMAGLPSGLRHQVVALAEVEGIFVQNTLELEKAQNVFKQKIALEKKKAAVTRSLMLKVMQEEGVPTVKDKHVTVSVLPGRERLKCVDIDKVDGAFKHMNPVADIASAKRWMKETGEVPGGFEHERGEPTIAVRRK